MFLCLLWSLSQHKLVSPPEQITCTATPLWGGLSLEIGGMSLEKFPSDVLCVLSRMTCFSAFVTLVPLSNQAPFEQSGTYVHSPSCVLSGHVPRVMHPYILDCSRKWRFVSFVLTKFLKAPPFTFGGFSVWVINNKQYGHPTYNPLGTNFFASPGSLWDRPVHLRMASVFTLVCWVGGCCLPLSIFNVFRTQTPPNYNDPTRMFLCLPTTQPVSSAS